MLGRLHIIVFLLICLISSALGAGLAVGALRFFSASKTFNAFGDVIAALTLVPLGFVAPSVVLFSIRREQRQSLKEFYAEQARQERQILPPSGQESGDDDLIDVEQDHYGVLRIAPTASQAEIDKSYYDIVDELSATGEHGEFEFVKAAYAVLGTQEMRVKYDLARLLRENGASQAAPARSARDQRTENAKRPILSLASVAGGFLLFVAGAVLTFVALELLYERQVFS